MSFYSIYLLFLSLFRFCLSCLSATFYSAYYLFSSVQWLLSFGSSSSAYIISIICGFSVLLLLLAFGLSYMYGAYLTLSSTPFVGELFTLLYIMHNEMNRLITQWMTLRHSGLNTAELFSAELFLFSFYFASILALLYFTIRFSIRFYRLFKILFTGPVMVLQLIESLYLDIEGKIYYNWKHKLTFQTHQVLVGEVFNVTQEVEYFYDETYIDQAGSREREQNVKYINITPNLIAFCKPIVEDSIFRPRTLRSRVSTFLDEHCPNMDGYERDAYATFCFEYFSVFKSTKYEKDAADAYSARLNSQ